VLRVLLLLICFQTYKNVLMKMYFYLNC